MGRGECIVGRAGQDSAVQGSGDPNLLRVARVGLIQLVVVVWCLDNPNRHGVVWVAPI